jgi:hypothetical protein
MSEHLWGHDDEPERPIAVLRSRPIRLRFEPRTSRRNPDALGLATYYGDRRIAMTPVTPERYRAITRHPAFEEPVRVVGVAFDQTDDGFLVIGFTAEVSERYGWHESEIEEVFLGTRFRGNARRRHPDDLEREARDFFLSILQGRPRVVVEQLCEAARKEADWRAEWRENAKQRALADGLPADGSLEPPRDVLLESVWRKRMKGIATRKEEDE